MFTFILQRGNKMDAKFSLLSVFVSSRWERCGQVKVVVKIESEEDMLVLQVNALPCFMAHYCSKLLFWVA
jgi:peptidyl-tRNA hydrolase